MKKLLALVMVLVVASVVSAGVEWTFTSGAAGDTVTISLVTTDATTVKGVALPLISDGGAGGFAANGAVNASLSSGLDNGYNGATLASWGFTGTAGDWGAASGTALTGVAGVIFSYDYTIDAAFVGDSITFAVSNLEGLMDYQVLTSDGSVAASSFAMSVVPEPMTLGLLGLGGLFLRRRK